MSDNPQYGSDDSIALPGVRVLRLDGRDAVAFAQSQFMNDVAALGDLQWQWNGWLDPKGRLQALFALLRIDAETLWIVTTTDAAAFADALRRFVFRAKVRIEDAGLHAAGRLSAPTAASGNRAEFCADGTVELDLSGDAGPRALRLSDAPPVRGQDAASWWRLDIAHGWSALPGVSLAAWTPQQLSLQRLDAFSVRKGCYPGQEIVARTHFLGRAKRGLARFRIPGAAAGDALQDEAGRDIGQIVCTVGDDALAVVPLDAPAPFQHNGTAIEPVPMASGLER